MEVLPAGRADVSAREVDREREDDRRFMVQSRWQSRRLSDAL
jgi:hypothetical protein